MSDFTAAATALVETGTTETTAPPADTTPVPAESQGAADAPPAASESAPSPPKSTAAATTPAKQPTTPKPSSAAAVPQPSGDLTKALRDSRTETKRWKDAYGWLPQNEIAPVRTFIEAWKRDPVGTLVAELQTLIQTPQYGGTLRQQIQALAGVQQAAPDDEEPEPDLQTTDGRLVRSDANARAWLEWRDRQNEKKFQEKLKPIEEFVSQRQQQDVFASMKSTAARNADALVKEMQSYPHFNENIDAIREKYDEFKQHMSGEKALTRAYLAVLHEQVLPGLSNRDRAAVAAQLQRKPGATTPNPARPSAPAGMKPAGGFREAAERLYGRA